LIEQVGMERALTRIRDADILLWLGPRAECPEGTSVIVLESKSDLTPPEQRQMLADLYVSPKTGENMDALTAQLIDRSRALLPGEGEAAWNNRHRTLLAECLGNLLEAQSSDDLLIIAEALRLGRGALDRITGRAGVEDMLDNLFGQFCIGK